MEAGSNAEVVFYGTNEVNENFALFLSYKMYLLQTSVLPLDKIKKSTPEVDAKLMAEGKSWKSKKTHFLKYFGIACDLLLNVYV